MLRIVCGVIAACSLAVSISPVRAQTEWPWCALLIQEDSMASNCGFISLEQCERYLSGMGGYCERNPFYRAEAMPSDRRPVPRR